MRGPPVGLRELTAEEASAVESLARSRTAAARRVERARIVWRANQGETPPTLAETLGLSAETVRRRMRRFNTEGLAAFEDHHRSGRPATYSGRGGRDGDGLRAGQPAPLGSAVRVLDVDRLAAYLMEHKALAIRRSRIDEILLGEGLRWRRQETWFGERVDPEFAEKGAHREALTAPPDSRIGVCLDEMGPVSAKSYPGRGWFDHNPHPRAGPTRVDYGRRGKGSIFGAFGPATGAAFTRPYPGRGTAHWVAFLEEVEGWLPQEVERVYAIADNLSSHRAPDVLLFMLAHPRWEMVFQPKYAAYLNLIDVNRPVKLVAVPCGNAPLRLYAAPDLERVMRPPHPVLTHVSVSSMVTSRSDPARSCSTRPAL